LNTTGFWLGVCAAAASVPVVAAATYLATLAVLARHAPRSDAPRPEPLRFDIIIPAHDEQAGIAKSVRSLLDVDYPAELRHVIVVADNCTDVTARLAEEAGARVITRNDTERRGKGHALERAFADVLQRAWADAVVVVDADTSVTPNLLWEFTRALRNGAQAAQAHYGVRNPDASWRTRLMAIAFTLFHGVRSLARERLGLSAGLRGNGMAFARDLLARVPHDAYSLVEDVEYGIKLGLVGARVWYVGDAEVAGDMVEGEKQSRSQRRRWEDGRRAIKRNFAGRLLAQGLRNRNAMLLDLACDLYVPPLTRLVMASVAGLALTTTLALAWSVSWWASLPWAFSGACLALYVVRGVMLSRTGWRGWLALLWAPVYVVWKVVLALRGSGNKSGEWVRTARGDEGRGT
jgi:1,2-diacylglycerol 3-beta-glucosyltransferase